MNITKDEVTDIVIKHLDRLREDLDRLREDTEKKWDSLERSLDRIEKMTQDHVNKNDSSSLKKNNLAIGGVIGAVSAIAGGAVGEPITIALKLLGLLG